MALFSEDPDAFIEEIEEFLTGARAGSDPDRVLATLLLTDIADSTKLAAEFGDRRLKDLLVLRMAKPRSAARHAVPNGNDTPPTPQAP
jgi:class 3 adenylate cyclase